jgi:hypothetical protein
MSILQVDCCVHYVVIESTLQVDCCVHYVVIESFIRSFVHLI